MASGFRRTRCLLPGKTGSTPDPTAPAHKLQIASGGLLRNRVARLAPGVFTMLELILVWAGAIVVGSLVLLTIVANWIATLLDRRK